MRHASSGPARVSDHSRCRMRTLFSRPYCSSHGIWPKSAAVESSSSSMVLQLAHELAERTAYRLLVECTRAERLQGCHTRP